MAGKAIGYARVSTGKQAKEGTSLSDQALEITDFARERGYDLIEVVEEAGKSGGIKDGEIFAWESRVNLQDLIARAEAGEFEAVIVAKLDRLARDHVTQVVVRRMLSKAGVTLHSCHEDNGDSAEAKLQQNILSCVADYERDLIKARLLRGKAFRKRQGRHVHGRVPYGYFSERGQLGIDPDTAPVVRSIFQLAGDGSSCGRIARKLNSQGTLSPTGKLWNPKVVRGILLNDTYTGQKYGVRRAHTPVVSSRLASKARATLEANRKRTEA